MRKWTKQQTETIAHRDGHLLVSASAGSGKTAVLIERIYALIEEGTDPSEVLVVTFTNSAAEEMRSRLADRLSASSDERLLSMALRLEDAQVSTLHSFCGEILRAHFDAVGIDPGFRLMDKMDADNRFEQALQAALEEAYEQNDADFAALHAMYGPHAKLGEIVKSLHDYSRAQADPEVWLARGAALYAQEDFSDWRSECAGKIAFELNHACTQLENGIEATEGIAALDGYRKLMEGELRAMRKVRLGVLNDDDTDLQSFTFARLPSVREKSPEKDSAQECRNTAKRIVQKMQSESLLLGGGADDLAQQRPAMQALAALTLRTMDIYQQSKREAALLDFSDLEHYALQALRDEDIATEYRRQFKYVFVDEYQDISPVQDALIFAVARGDNAFLVGDIKQSIYRFRRAEPRIFLEKQKRWGDGDGGKRIILGHNFRSRRNILDGVNAVFSKIMHEDEAEIEYTEQEFLRYGASHEGDDPPIELHILRADAEVLSEEIADFQAIQREALLIAREAAKLHAGGMAYGDMAVLLRSARSRAPQMQDILLAQGIPAMADTSEGFFAVWEVRMLLALLQLLNNMRSDIALLSVLRVFGGFSEDELAEIRANCPQGSYVDAYILAAEQPAPARDFLATIDRWRDQAAEMRIDDLLQSLLEETDFTFRLDALPGAQVRAANVRILLSMAQDFAARGEGGLAQFLDYAARLERRGESPEPARMGKDEDILRIMTIHKSKGLEFGAVFLANMGADLRVGRSETIDMHPDLGFALPYRSREPKIRRKTLAQSAILWRKRREEFAEEARLLYVALTRAQDRLYLIGTSKATPLRPPDGGLLSMRNYLDMVLSALPAASQPEGDMQAQGAKFSCTIHNAIDYNGATTTLEDTSEEIALPDSIRYRYESPAVQPPEKITVTQLRQALTGWTIPEDEPLPSALFEAQEMAHPLHIPAPHPLERPTLLAEQKGLTGAQRGSLTHDLLGLLPLEPLRVSQNIMQTITECVQDMLARGVFAADALATVDIASIAAFFEGALGQRMLRSSWVLREHPFNLRLSARDFDAAFPEESLLLQGVIDACFMEADAWILVEYKTDRAPQREIAERYRTQLHWYAQALERLTGIPVRESLLYALHHGQII